MKLGELRKLSRAIRASDGPGVQKEVERRMQEAGLNPNAFYQELEMTSALVDTHRDVSWSNSHLQLHSHSFFELLWCAECDGVEYLVGSERYRLRKGDLIFVPPGISHRPLLPEKMEKPYRRYVLWLSPRFMELYAGLYPGPFTDKQAKPSMLRTGGTHWERLGELFLAGVRESEQRPDGWEAAVVGNTLTLLTRIKRATDAQTARTLEAEKPELLDRIMAYVEERYPEDVTLESVARESFVSESTVSHLFKQKLGVSFHRYLTQRRLIAAKTLIAQGLPLEQVAERCGFRDYSGFYRAFRQEYGISPRKYRSL